MAYDEKLAVRVNKAFAGAKGIIEKKMFGGLCFMEHGAMCCGLVGDELMVRVGPDAYDAALSMPHARPMNFTGRPMRGFVYVGIAGCATQANVNAWVARGRSFVAELAARPDVDEELRTLLTEHTPGIRKLTFAARALFKTVVPSTIEGVRHGWKLLGFSAPRYYACLVPMKDHVRIGFEHGHALDDPWGILETSGKQMTWLTIRNPGDLKRPGVTALIAQAAEYAQDSPPKRRKA
jgi:hypothetical protein